MSDPVAIIACGGTGGHLTPGIALADALREHGVNSLLLVSEKSIDKRMLEKYPGLEALPAPGSGFSIRPIAFAKFLRNAWRGFRFARKLVRERRPGVFVSFGGFLSFGPALACRLAGVPVVLHEANRVPGKAVRYLGATIATRVWLPDGVKSPWIRDSVLRHAGFPVRKEIQPLPKAEARHTLGFPEDGLLLLVFGGSQGAAVLNNWARENLAKITAAGAHLLCVTGPGNNATPPAAPDTEAASATATSGVVRFIPFCHNMPEALSAADLAVARAGAGTIAEFVACGLPAVLVPLPTAKDNHQEENARHLAQLGGCCIAPQSRPDEMLDATLNLLGDTAKREAMRGTLGVLRERFAWKPMVAEIMEMLRR